MASKRSITVALALQAPAGTNADGNGAPQATWTAQAAMRVKHVKITLPPGSAGELHLIPYVEGPDNDRDSCIVFAKGGYGYVSGDAVQRDFDCDFPVPAGGRVVAWYDNQDATNAHEFAMDVTLVNDPGGGA